MKIEPNWVLPLALIPQVSFAIQLLLLGLMDGDLNELLSLAGIASIGAVLGLLVWRNLRVVQKYQNGVAIREQIVIYKMFGSLLLLGHSIYGCILLIDITTFGFFASTRMVKFMPLSYFAVGGFIMGHCFCHIPIFVLLCHQYRDRKNLRRLTN
jgi:hypothetical protein